MEFERGLPPKPQPPIHTPTLHPECVGALYAAARRQPSQASLYVSPVVVNPHGQAARHQACRGFERPSLWQCCEHSQHTGSTHRRGLCRGLCKGQEHRVRVRGVVLSDKISACPALLSKKGWGRIHSILQDRAFESAPAWSLAPHSRDATPSPSPHSPQQPHRNPSGEPAPCSRARVQPAHPGARCTVEGCVYSVFAKGLWRFLARVRTRQRRAGRRRRVAGPAGATWRAGTITAAAARRERRRAPTGTSAGKPLCRKGWREMSFLVVPAAPRGPPPRGRVGSVRGGSQRAG